MELVIRCVNCSKNFFGCLNTVRVYGTTIEVNCPYCNKKTINNISKFCENQIRDVDDRLYKSKLMIQMSRIISKLFNNDYKK